MNKGIFDRVCFTVEDKAGIERLRTLSASSDFATNNASHIVLRELTSSLPNNIDSFVIYTSAHPEDKIIYTSQTDIVDLSIKDGGFF